MKINIAGGRGIIGGVHKPIFENAGHEVIISGRYSSPSLEEAAQQSDLTIVSVPIDAAESVIKKTGRRLHNKCAEKSINDPKKIREFLANS